MCVNSCLRSQFHRTQCADCGGQRPALGRPAKGEGSQSGAGFQPARYDLLLASHIRFQFISLAGWKPTPHGNKKPRDFFSRGAGSFWFSRENTTPTACGEQAEARARVGRGGSSKESFQKWLNSISTLLREVCMVKI